MPGVLRARRLAIGRSVIDRLHPDTRSFRDRLIAGGNTIKPNTLSLLNSEFVAPVNSYNAGSLRAKLKEVGLLIGDGTAYLEKLWYPATISSKLTVNGTVLNYTEPTGIQGNSAGNLRTGFVPTSQGLSLTNNFAAVYLLNTAYNGVPLGSGPATGGNVYVSFKQSTSSSQLSYMSGANPVHPFAAGLKAITANSSLVSTYTGESLINTTALGSLAPSQEMVLLNHGTGFPFDSRVGAYFLGETLDINEVRFLNEKINNFFWSIGRKIPQLANSSFFFGDSITAGSGASVTANRWSSLTASSLGVTEVNKGISGTTLQNTTPILADNGRDRWQKDLTLSGAGKVYILYGLNDLRYNGASFSAANFQNDLGEIVAGLIQGGITPENIILGSPPYMNPAFFASNSPYDAGSTIKQEQYRDAARTVALQYKTKYADVYQAMLDGGDSSLISADGVHPNDSGHNVIKNAMLAASVPTN